MACNFPYLVSNPALAGFATIPVPCGKCYDCKLRIASQWAFRLQQHERISISSMFVTLTYNTITVPISPHGYMSLDYATVQRFWKRLRKTMEQELKYFIVGEYGTKKMRPHYHAIVFNATQEQVVNSWGLGDVHIGDVTGASIAYTLKYMMKEAKIPAHPKDDRVKEFRKMSKGLGKNYLTDEIQRYHHERPADIIVRSLQGHVISMPRYYRNALWNKEDQARQAKLIEALHNKIQARKEKEHAKKVRQGTTNTKLLKDYDQESSEYRHKKAIAFQEKNRRDD